MKQALFYYYRLKVIEIIPVTEKVSRIVCAEGKYALKQSASDHIERICRYIQSLHLKMFVPVVMTVENHFYFVYQQRYYYLMPWLDFEEEMVEELKLRSYFQRICQLHNETFYVSQVQEGYFAKEIEWATKEVQCRRQFYEKLMVQSEKSDYKAPWHWQMLRLYREVMINLESGERYIQDYQIAWLRKKLAVFVLPIIILTSLIIVLPKTNWFHLINVLSIVQSVIYMRFMVNCKIDI